MPSPAASLFSYRTFCRAFVVLALALLSACLYRMFDYALNWSSGWKPLPAALPAQVGFADPQWSAAASAADAELRAAQAGTHAPAISAAVWIQGRRVWAGALGWSDIDAQTPVSLESSFRLGSTSKAINSVALGTLLDSGRIDLDAPVRTYLKGITEPLASVTTRQAISHTAGIRNYGLCLCFPVWEQFSRRDFGRSARAGLEVFADDALLFAPGTRFAYSSYGTNVSGAVIEAVAGTDYLAYVQTAVFDRLGMDHSGGDFARAEVPGRVRFYDVQEGRYRPAYAVNNSIKWPSGGMIASPSDMLLLGQAMLESRLFSSATRDLLVRPQALADGSANDEGYALGWRYFAEKKLFDGKITTPFYTHHGTAVGGVSYFAVYPDQGLVISLMANKSEESLDALYPHANRLAELFIAEFDRQSAR
jgi:serine beta-lactamase-like protein LACTB, mitochondrial